MSPTPPMGFETDTERLRAIGHATPPSTSPNVVILTTSGPLGTAFKPSQSHRKPCGPRVTGIASVTEDHLRHAESGFRDLVGRRAGGKGTAFKPCPTPAVQGGRGRARTRLHRGSSIDSLAERLQVNRTTIIRRLDLSGVARRRVVRKMTDLTVHRAATRYESGESLKTVAATFGVDARTLARELKRAGFTSDHGVGGRRANRRRIGPKDRHANEERRPRPQSSAVTSRCKAGPPRLARRLGSIRRFNREHRDPRAEPHLTTRRAMRYSCAS